METITITKKTQIEAQKETIESLTRKVESLEGELQKCLDPDSGEFKFKPITPAVNQQGFKGMKRSNFLESRIEIIISSLFMVTRTYDEQINEFKDNYHVWWCFRSFLFDVDLLADRWSDPTFREGVELLNTIIEITNKELVTIEQIRESDIADRFFNFIPPHDKPVYNAVQSLISSLQIIIQNQEHTVIKNIMEEEYLYDMLACLETIAFCQKLWMEAELEERNKN